MTVYLLWSTLHCFGEREILHGIYANENVAREDARAKQENVSVDREEYHIQPYHVTAKNK